MMSVSSGAIKDQVYYGYKGIQYCRTLKEPKQPIPTFAETVALLMQVYPQLFTPLPLLTPCRVAQPENMHVKFNIDVKVNSEPTRLFTLMRETLTSVPNWETALAPRLLVGLWHPAFLAPCTEFLPHCRRSYIGLDVSIARKHFWECDAFSVNFNELTTPSGQAWVQPPRVDESALMGA
jgi:phosphatidylglycerol phospholipase C